MSYQCKGKVRHPTRQGAIIALRRVKNIAMDIYQCPSCKGWHLGRTREASRCADRITQVLDLHAAALAKRMEGRNG